MEKNNVGNMPEIIFGKKHSAPEFEVVEINRGKFFVASPGCTSDTCSGDGGCGCDNECTENCSD